ncbi:MAG: DUF4105 domain-containing protein [Xanthomonadales bacterium]|nr:DUF4105 domain-containing protein [Xanthomonadales bacterium]
MARLHINPFFIFLLIIAAGLHCERVQAQDPVLPLASGQPEAWLVTYGPGELYWQRFGHNAIWIRDPSRNIDHVFNAGFFDFNQPGFLRRFIEGRMLYFSAAQPALDEFRQYQFDNRSIQARPLRLDLVEYERLLNHLVWQVDPEHRHYLYDYYLDNCSTRIRDAIDVALAGQLSSVIAEQVARQNFRDHTRRSTEAVFWYYLGLETALGLPTDRNISRWQEMFLPAVVDEVIAGFEREGRPVAGDLFTIWNSSLEIPPATPPFTAWRYLLAGLLLTGFFSLMGRLAGEVMAQGSINAYLVIAAQGGLLLTYLWTMTDHQVASPNANLLLLNPLLILGLWPRLRRLAALVLLAGVAFCMVQLLLPGGQYNLDVLAFLAPVNLAVGWWLWRNAPDL